MAFCCWASRLRAVLILQLCFSSKNKNGAGAYARHSLLQAPKRVVGLLDVPSGSQSRLCFALRFASSFFFKYPKRSWHLRQTPTFEILETSCWSPEAETGFPTARRAHAASSLSCKYSKRTWRLRAARIFEIFTISLWPPQGAPGFPPARGAQFASSGGGVF